MSPPDNYEALPTEDERERELEETISLDDEHGRRAEQARQLQRDPRFSQPKPPLWSRIALLAFIAFLFWLSFNLRYATQTPPKVVHATRYSREHKFRPAASPIITERLKDGRVRVRGAAPEL
ncbi:hypothetical protein PLICRDRAFT_43344 [Plicaturopsis crispa FD-325 SS-3]|nr:hypothetical protein PLICRDRAFT_43344 [Plicaturopsis crispa FD-325 SS-3]